MFISRKPTGEPYGLFTVRQYPEHEEIEESHPDVIGFLERGMTWGSDSWRTKTVQELDSEKTAVASEALKLVASCLLEAVFDMKANPANYPTAASLKQKALELYKARL